MSRFIKTGAAWLASWGLERRNPRKKRAHVVLLTEFLVEGSGHDLAADGGRGIEVGLARLASGDRYV